MNIVMLDRILELTDKRPRFYKIKLFVKNWKTVTLVSIVFLTAKVAAEQLVMIFIRH